MSNHDEYVCSSSLPFRLCFFSFSFKTADVPSTQFLDVAWHLYLICKTSFTRKSSQGTVFVAFFVGWNTRVSVRCLLGCLFISHHFAIPNPTVCARLAEHFDSLVAPGFMVAPG